MTVLSPDITTLYIVNGEVQTQRPIPGAFVQTLPRNVRRGREKDVLLLHVTVSGPIDEAQILQAQIIEKFQEMYYRTPGTITIALRRAVTTANQHLLKYNMRHNSATMRTGALCAAVLREDELHLVQVGESQAYIGHNFGLEAVPAVQQSQLIPLGEQSGINVQMFHTWLQEDETLLLLDPRLIHIDKNIFSPILVDQSLSDMNNVLATMLTNNSARLILAKMSAVNLPLHRTGTKKADRPRPITERSNVPIASTKTDKQQPTVNNQNTQPIAPIRPHNIEPNHTQQSPASRAARNGLASILFGLANRVRQLAAMLSSSKDQQSNTIRTRWWIVTIVVMVLSINGIMGTVLFQRERVTALSIIKQDIAQAWVYADHVGVRNPALQRTYYDYILYQIDIATQIADNDSQILAWQVQAQQMRDKEEGIIRLSGSRIIDYGSDTQMYSVVLGQLPSYGIYALNNSENAVYLSETNREFDVSADPRLLTAGESIIGTHVVGDIIDLDWRDQNIQVTESGVVLLDRSGALITHFANDEQISTPLGFASQWKNPVKMTGYAGRIYVLDRGNSPNDAKIWRYLVQETRLLLDNEKPAINFPDLHLATDFVINEDGTVIVLYQDGRIRRYATSGRTTTLWDERVLAENGLTEPLVNPQAIYVTGAGFQSVIYVLDPGSSRLIKISMGGTVIDQYRVTTTGDTLDLFANTVDFVIKDAPLRIYALTKNALYVATPP